MAELSSPGVWRGRMVFAIICLVLVFLKLLPLEALVVPDFPERWQPTDPLPVPPAPIAYPDVILAVVMVWAARRPDFVPVLLVAGIIFLTDLLFQRPPGLWTALVVCATEFLRARSNAMRGLPFGLEWVTASCLMLLVVLTHYIALVLADVPQTGILLQAQRLIWTCALYPVVCVVAHLVFGVSRPAPGEVDAMGHRL